MCTIAASLGAIIGAWLLTVTNEKTFKMLVPWLLRNLDVRIRTARATLDEAARQRASERGKCGHGYS
jgi:hypothetical protein